MFQYDIKAYLSTKLKGNIKEASGGEEITINSLFCPDTNYHLSVNAVTGLWICFKTGNKGNFIRLYSILEGMSYREAEQRITFSYIRSHLLDPQTKIEVNEKEFSIDILEEISPYQEITTCNGTESDAYKKAFKLVYERKLFSSHSTFFISTRERYRNRLIIPFTPFRHKSKKLFYFQARALSSEKPKYLNCPRQKKSVLLYPYDTSQESVLVCEGPLDALSLQIQGVNATAVMGSYVSLQQLTLLIQNPIKIVLAFDSDESGRSALERTNSYRKLLRIPEIFYCFPPEGFKDWNDAHVADIDLKSYVNNNTKLLSWEELALRDLSRLEE